MDVAVMKLMLAFTVLCMVGMSCAVESNDVEALLIQDDNDTTEETNHEETDLQQEQNDPATCRRCRWTWLAWTPCRFGYQTRRMRIIVPGCNCPRIRYQRRRCDVCRPCKWTWGPWTPCRNGYQTRRLRILVKGCNCPRTHMQRRRCFYTCWELKFQHNIRISDVYPIWLPSGTYRVYCEMGINGGGYTFIPRPMIPKLTAADINVLFRRRRDVLLRVLRPDGTEPYTVVKQYRNTAGLTVQLNNYVGQDRAPMNQGLGPYLLLGTLDKNVAVGRTTQGFMSNNKPILYNNCHRAGRNFFAFFGNHKEAPVSTYHNGNLVYEKIRVAVDWRKSAVRPYSGSRLPTDYYLFTEMHFGGCGCYTSSDRWLNAVSPALGTAIGLR